MGRMSLPNPPAASRARHAGSSGPWPAVALTVLVGAATLNVMRAPGDPSAGGLLTVFVAGCVLWLGVGPWVIWRLLRLTSGMRPWRRTLGTVLCIAVLACAFGPVLGWVAALVGLRRPAPWFANVFWYLDVNLAALLLAVAVERLLRHQRDLAQREGAIAVLSRELAQVRQLFLARQVRPHFLFNALNAAAADARSRPAVAAETLRSLRTLFESAALAERTPTQTLAEELRILQAFVTIAKARYDVALDIILDADARALTALVPPLALQPILENAIQFAMSAGLPVGRVRMYIGADGETVRIVARNTVAAHGGGTGLGIGLQNTRRRLELLYGRAFTLTHEREGDEFVVDLTIPFLRETSAAGADFALDAPVEAPARKWWRRTIRGAAFAVVCWMAIGVFWSYQMHFYRVARGVTWLPILASGSADFVVAAVWTVLSPIILHLARRFPVTSSTWWTYGPLHLAAAIAAGLVERSALSLAGFLPVIFAAKVINQLSLDCLLYGLILAWGEIQLFTSWLQSRRQQAASMQDEIDETLMRSRTLGADPALTADVLGRLADRLAVSPVAGEEGIVRTADALRLLLAVSDRATATLGHAVRAAGAAIELRSVAAASDPRIECVVPHALRAAMVHPGSIVALGYAVPLAAQGETHVRVEAARTAEGGLEVTAALVGDGASWRTSVRVAEATAADEHAAAGAHAPRRPPPVGADAARTHNMVQASKPKEQHP